MKTLPRFAASTALALITGAVCFGQHYIQSNLVSNTLGVAPVTDPQLINPWGLSRSSSSPWWISDNATGLSTLYNGAGAKQSLIVTIPQADPNDKNTPTGTPTGTIANGSRTDFLLAPGKPAVFLFSTIDGTIAGWNPTVAVAQGAAPPSTQAVTVVKTTDGSSYTGLTSAFIDGKRYLYAANFTKGRVDVYDNAFQPVNLSKGHFDEDWSACRVPTCLSTCKPSATTLSSPMCSTRKVRALKPTARVSASWPYILPPVGSCTVLNTVIG